MTSKSLKHTTVIKIPMCGLFCMWLTDILRNIKPNFLRSQILKEVGVPNHNFSFQTLNNFSIRTSHINNKKKSSYNSNFQVNLWKAGLTHHFLQKENAGTTDPESRLQCVWCVWSFDLAIFCEALSVLYFP